MITRTNWCVLYKLVYYVQMNQDCFHDNCELITQESTYRKVCVSKYQ